jgi:hypothetical protein
VDTGAEIRFRSSEKLLTFVDKRFEASKNSAAAAELDQQRGYALPGEEAISEVFQRIGRVQRIFHLEQTGIRSANRNEGCVAK